ncbi:MAG TPA: glycosyltransferase family 4 protein [Jatrophihabitantaceae bacterium]
MPVVHVVVPDGFDDPGRPSGGNVYDRQVIAGLAAAGWDVRTHPVPGAWPSPSTGAQAPVQAELDALAPGSVVIIDGLIASGVPRVLVRAAGRLALVVLMHMPVADEAERAAVTAARAVITTSEWTRDRILDLYGLPRATVHVAEPGVAPADLAPGTAHGGRLLCVAAVTPQKGHDVLFRALARLRSPDWTCRCVGPLDRAEPFVARLRRQVEVDGIADRVTLVGALGDTDTAAAYQRADVLVLPSRGETYGMVVTEALARGLPVIATEVGGVPESLGTAPSGRPGLLVPPEDDAALAGALQAWLTDPALRGRLRRSARERRHGLPDWSGTIERIARVLRMYS